VPPGGVAHGVQQLGDMRFAAAFTSFLLLTTPGLAHASTPIECDDPPEPTPWAELLNAGDRLGLMPELAVAVGSHPEPRFELRSAAHPVEVETLASSSPNPFDERLVLLSPAEPLLPLHDYTMAWRNGAAVAAFRTGNGQSPPRPIPPPPPEVVPRGETHPALRCDQTPPPGVTLDFDFRGRHVAAVVEEGDDLDDAAVTEAGGFSAAGESTLRLYADLERGEIAHVVVGTIDPSGGFSGWSEPFEVRMPPVTSCSVGASHPLGAGGLALLLGLVWGRRRRP